MANGKLKIHLSPEGLFVERIGNIHVYGPLWCLYNVHLCGGGGAGGLLDVLGHLDGQSHSVHFYFLYKIRC